ncbi:MAG: hypothetical protein ACU84J_08580 [Gammaproteobacteria bacterium]
MKILKHLKKISGALLIPTAVVLLAAGCSDDNKPKTANAGKPSASLQHNAFDHSHGTEVTDLEKHKFEHEFADQCVARELRQSANKEESDRQRLAKPCMCIAQFMMKDLTAKEAEKFLKEHKDTQSLRIRFENAAYHCLQQTAQPKPPKLFGKS